MTKRVFGTGLLLSVVGAMSLAGGAAPLEAQERRTGERLGTLIQERLRADGPFFTAEERAVIERACGYPAGSFDGYEANMQDDEFVCRDGRRVDSPEVRAVMATARSRIGARVRSVMESAEVRREIDAIAERETAAALRAVDASRIAEEASERARVAVQRAMARMEAAQERRGRR